MLDFYTVLPHAMYMVIPGQVLESFHSFIGEKCGEKAKKRERCGF